MRYHKAVSVVGVIVLSAFAANGWAEEAAAPVAAESAPAEAAVSAAPVASVAAVPAAPTLRPIAIKFLGEIVQATKEASGNSVLTVRDRYGVTKEMTADPASVKVVRGTDPATIDDLQPGDQITVDYTYDVASGKRFVQAILVGTTSKSHSPASN